MKYAYSLEKKKYENIPAFMFPNTKLQCNKRSFFAFFVICSPLKQVKSGKTLVLWWCEWYGMTVFFPLCFRKYLKMW